MTVSELLWRFRLARHILTGREMKVEGTFNYSTVTGGKIIGRSDGGSEFTIDINPNCKWNPQQFTVYAQRDARWKDILLGEGDLTIGHIGCALCSCAMAATVVGCPITPPELNDWLKLRNFYVGTPKNLIDWPKITDFCPRLSYEGWLDYRNKPVDMDNLGKLLLRGPVIAELDWDSSDTDIDQHFVVILSGTEDGGDVKIADPWLGGVVRLADSPYYNPAWGKEGLDRVARVITGLRLLMPRAN